MRLLIVVLMVAAATPAVAQDAAPARNANVYDGTAHQPSAGGVQSQEKAAGVAPAPAQQRQLDDSVEQLGAQVQGNASDAGRKAAACAANPSNC